MAERMGREPLAMTAEVWKAIVAHSLEARPNEACGLLVDDAGSGLPGIEGPGVSGRGLRYYIARNVAENPLASFMVDPDDQLSAASSGRAIVGLVHSHPDGESRPSDWDKETYVPTGWWYLVVGMAGGQPFVGCYRKNDLGSFEKRKLLVT